METRGGPASGRGAGAQEREVVEEVVKAIRSIDYGSVLITIHQGEVVGIETSRKLRLRKPAS